MLRKAMRQTACNLAASLARPDAAVSLAMLVRRQQSCHLDGILWDDINATPDDCPDESLISEYLDSLLNGPASYPVLLG